MKKMKKRPFDTVRVTSIARKINLNHMGRLFLTYIATDVLVFALLSAIFVVGMDLQMAGNFFFHTPSSDIPELDLVAEL